LRKERGGKTDKFPSLEETSPAVTARLEMEAAFALPKSPPPSTPHLHPTFCPHQPPRGMNPVGDLTENWDEKATSAGQHRPLHERVCSSSADSALHGFA